MFNSFILKIIIIISIHVLRVYKSLYTIYYHNLKNCSNHPFRIAIPILIEILYCTIFILKFCMTIIRQE